MADKKKLLHLFLEGTSKTERYTSPLSGGPRIHFPTRDRKTHGAFLKERLESIQKESENLKEEKSAFGINAANGVCLQFESDYDFPLKFESLESIRSGIELLSVREIDGKTYAIVFVPEGKLSHFTRQIKRYLEEETSSGKPKNKPLVNSISDIHRAVIDALWTDDLNMFPDDGKEIWWEVWLRAGGDRESIIRSYKEQSERLGLKVGEQYISFPDRTVILTHGSKEQMSKSAELLNCIAELRKAKETPETFMDMSSREQADWSDDALSRLTGPALDSPSVCILDTGVNNGHPLIAPALNSLDMHSYKPSWGIEDHEGHGTGMAGLAIYDDLVQMLETSGPIELTHVIESVKILPPIGENEQHLYGNITSESVARVEITAPTRKRVSCLAITTTDFRDRGMPSSWSAAIDNLCSGAEDNQQRLFLISAGNTNMDFRHDYPDSNTTDNIHDPGQAWNALTIGAFTEKHYIDQSKYSDWAIIAPLGDLSPSSCTSMMWDKQWPLKPDIVFEGGNMAINPVTGTADNLDSLQLLTTYWQPLSRLFDTVGETSAATALASRMAAMVYAAYPNMWPETVRALLVHSAKWTGAMTERFNPSTSRRNTERLLKHCGFGTPNLNEALWSAANSLTLLVQDTLQPYDKDGSSYKTRDMHIHNIPWPTEVLEELGEVEVEMRVTLSYFIEPNPGRRGWVRRHRYASHGLRFDVKTATESEDDFRRRINKAARDEEFGKTSDSDSSEWMIGPKLRGRGSVHSDKWKGLASDLASRGYIAVYPVIGWWRERHQLGKWNKNARYSLVVTINSPETDVDIYTEVLNKISTPIDIDT